MEAKTKKILIWAGIGSALLVIVGVIGYNKGWFSKKTDEKTKDALDKIEQQKLEEQKKKDEAAASGGGKTYTPPPANENFPLNLGMKGSKVKALQVALRDKWKANLGKWGADGSFGKDTISALKVTGYDSPVSEPDFNSIVAGKKKVIVVATPPPPKKTEVVKLYAKVAFTPVWNSTSQTELTPYLLAGKDEELDNKWLGGTQKDFFGNPFYEMDFGGAKKYVAVANAYEKKQLV